jgi:hypothetical protein
VCIWILSYQWAIKLSSILLWSTTGYPEGRLVDSSPMLISNLSKLHEYGLLTVEGQESEKDHGICMEDEGVFCGEILEYGNSYANEQKVT